MADKAQTSFEKLYNIDVSAYIEQKNGLNYLSWANAWAEFKKVHPGATYEVKKFENGLPYAYDPNTGYMVYTTVTVDGLTHEMWLPVMDGNNKAMKDDVYEYSVKNPKFKYAKWNKDAGKYLDSYGNEQKEYLVKLVQPATMFDINKTIMRCLTKNLAMFGLGLRVYNGEDLPETVEEQHFEPPKKAKAKKEEVPSGEDIKKMLNKSQIELAADLKKLLMKTDSDVKVFLEWASKRYKRNIRNVDEMIPTELEDAIIVVTKKKGDK